MTYRAFIALSGGGAKGVVHVGALKALEEKGVNLLGLSGTSAGAIVAALAAAGFTADDMIHSVSGRTILAELSAIDPKLRRATDLFGGRWWLVRWFWAGLARLKVGLLGLAIIWIASPLVAALLFRLSTQEVIVVWAVISISLGAVLALIYCMLIYGLASVDRFRNALATLLQRKLFPQEAGRVVCMGDFGRSGRPSLKIVSANLSRRSLHLFSPERTPEVAVADAVAASICLPVIFRPRMISGELHVDGGIVSNLPAWPFDEERELDPEALTVTVEVRDSGERKPLSRLTWPSAAIRTTLFGSTELNLRLSGPAQHLSLPTNFKMLDFERTGQEAASEVRQIAARTKIWLEKRLFRLPEIYRNACQVTQALALDGLQIAPGGRGENPRVRVAVGRLERNYIQSLRMSHSVGFEDDSDESMLIPIEGSVAGAAWHQGQSLYQPYPLPAEQDLPGAANRLRRKSRWRGAAWTMCIPISPGGDHTGPRLLIQIDGNSALPSSSEMDVALQGVEEAVKEFFRLVLSELMELEDSHVYEI